MRPKEVIMYLILLLGMLGMMAGISVPSFAQEPGDYQLSPDNPELSDYLQTDSGMRLDALSDVSAGLIPESIVLPNTGFPTTRSLCVTLPVAYDLRGISKLTAVRDQGSSGSCWAFATYGSLESSLLPGETLDFSENNLKNLSGYSVGPNVGGNRLMSAAYLARWAGPVLESSDPYNPSSVTSTKNLPVAKHVQDIIFIPGRTGALDNTAIKQAVMTYGAVYTTYYHSGSYLSSSTASYNYTGTASANHAVCIVGWDDNYPLSRFISKPVGNGAFLVRNSWGSWWGLSGYYWISYYDTKLAKTENAVFLAESKTNYTNIYQYDDLGWVSSFGFSNPTAWFANVFTAKTDETISAVSWYSATPGSVYEVYLYTSPTSGPINPSGYSSSKLGTLTTAGYHTIQLDSGVPVTQGQKFSVVVKLKTPGYTYPIPIERPYTGYTTAATASAGQSYYSALGTTWSDVTSYLPNTNVCLKAFSQGTSSPTAGVLSVTPVGPMCVSGPHNGPFNYKQTYTLTNTGKTAIDWTASSTGQTWLSLSSSGGTLESGASVTVDATVTSEADSLDPGTYTDTITFANTTNGNGNATRAVNLTVKPDPGILTVSSTDAVNISGFTGGPFTPATFTYTLSNTGQDTLSWAASKSSRWLSFKPASGTLAKGASTTVTLTVNSAAAILAAGSYSDTITFTNTTTGIVGGRCPVSLTVNAGSYQILPETYSWVSPPKTTLVPLADNAVSGAISIPFAFTFYSKQYTRLYIGSNGLIGFGTTGMTSYANTNLPNLTAPNAAIYPYWTNLNPGRYGVINYGTAGLAPNRVFVISWVDLPWGLTSAKFRFQALLYEATSDIVFQYANVSPTSTTYGGGNKATIGIENETGKLACKYEYNTYGSVSNLSAIRIGVRQ